MEDPMIGAGGLGFDTKDLMNSFHQNISDRKDECFDMLTRFPDEAAMIQHGRDTEIILKRALTLAEGAEQDLLQKLPVIMNDDEDEIIDGEYRSCMETLHGMHVRLHAAMLQQTTERVRQRDQLQNLSIQAATILHQFCSSLIEHIKDTLLALLGRKIHHAGTWQSTLARVCYNEMHRCDDAIQKQLDKAYDMGSSMETVIRQGIRDRLELERDVMTTLSSNINVRSEDTRKRMESIKSMKQEIQEQQSMLENVQKQVKSEEDALEKVKRSHEQCRNEIRDNREQLGVSYDRMQTHHAKALSFLQKMADKNRSQSANFYTQQKIKLVWYKLSCFRALHARLHRALITMQDKNVPYAKECLDLMDASGYELNEGLVACINNQDYEEEASGWWEWIGRLAVPCHIRNCLTTQRVQS